MCGIAFGERPFLEDTFTVQSDRGMDGVGILSANGDMVRCFLDDDLETFKYAKEISRMETGGNFYFLTDGKKKPRKFKTKEDFYTYYMESNMAYDGLVGNNFLVHHRKSSVGTKDVHNVHPYRGEKFSLLQNGTDHIFHHWGILEGFDSDKSDSYMMLQFLEKHAENLGECKAVLDSTADKADYGVVIVTDNDGRMLVYSDGERSLWIDKQDGKVVKFRSKETYLSKETKCVGWMIMDFDGNVIGEDWKEFNVEKPSKYKAPAYSAPTREPYDWVTLGHGQTKLYDDYSRYSPPTDSDKKMAEVEKFADDIYFKNDTILEKQMAIIDAQSKEIMRTTLEEVAYEYACDEFVKIAKQARDAVEKYAKDKGLYYYHYSELIHEMELDAKDYEYLPVIF